MNSYLFWREIIWTLYFFQQDYTRIARWGENESGVELTKLHLNSKKENERLEKEKEWSVEFGRRKGEEEVKEENARKLVVAEEASTRHVEVVPMFVKSTSAMSWACRNHSP